MASAILLCCGIGNGLQAGNAELLAVDAKSGAFRTEELRIPARDARLAGTLYVPVSGGPAPAVIFVHGAGPQKRWGYRELASHFASKGIAALIYDKRGCGASTGDFGSASLHDLAEDALSWARLLRARPDVNPERIGLWGLSQGGIIIPIAAGRSPEVAFLIAVGGPLELEEQMRYFRANLYRRRGLSKAVLDVANKYALFGFDLTNKIRSGTLPVPRAWRPQFRTEFDLDMQAIWRRVRQPVLAIYGENDKQVPVGPNIAQLREALTQSGNRDYEIIIYPGASHAIGSTRTGELGEDWVGYAPGYMDVMTDWVLRHADRRQGPSGPVFRGRPSAVTQPFPAGHYDRIRWYGNAIVQLLQLLMFSVGFLVMGVGGAVCLIRSRGRAGSLPDGGGRRWTTPVAVALSFLNLALVCGLAMLLRALGNGWEPHVPPVLDWLPLVGSASACLTLVFLALLVLRWRSSPMSLRTGIGLIVFATCAIAFVPFLHYWNLLGLAFH
jgi:pimeloyl-ACP methyl ester carboxylesterase